jgi:hypothetical protein
MRRDAAWFRRSGGAYVKSYAKKGARQLRGGQVGAGGRSQKDKSYQQDYGEIPSSLRTFQSTRTVHELAELDRHLDKLELQVVNNRGFWADPRTVEIWAVGQVLHIKAAGGCKLSPNTRRRPRSHRSLRKKESGSVAALRRIPA